MHRIWRLMFLALVLAAPLFCVGPTLADARPGVLDPSLAAAPVWRPGDDGSTMTVIVQLVGPTAFDLYRQTLHKPGELTSLAQRARESAFATVAMAQAPAREFIESTGAQILSTYDTALNGFLVRATSDQLQRLTATPRLERIYRAPEHYPLLGDAVPLVGGQTVIDTLGYTGKDVTIAIIDQGIDYTHKSLGGSGKPKDYADNNPSVVEPRSFPTDKVIGGYDFAGTDYGTTGVPRPDDDPLDEGDHGTHVAGIAAGMKGNPKVHHGVAPDAKLIALKVFGRGGGTNLSTNAIEWAIEANMGARVPGSCQMPRGQSCRVDVLNMSLGSPWANGVLEQTGAIQRAVESGIVLVAASGNDDDVPFIHGAPAASPMALAVANTFHGGLKGDVVEATAASETIQIEALQGGVDATGQMRLGKSMDEVGELKAPLADFGRGCNVDQAAAPDVTGQVALIERGTCSFSEKVANATAKGAVAALVYNNQAGIIVMGPTAGFQSDRIPAYLIRQADGLSLKEQLRAGEVRIRMAKALNGTFVRFYLADAIGLGSSRGPARSGAFKPNISAPGTEIFAPKRAQGDAGVAFTGTSMAAPMVAGGAAVLIERLRAQGLAPKDAPLSDPDFLTAADVAALLMNTATAHVYADDNRVPDYVPLARQGSGRMDLVSACTNHTLARAGNLAEIDFGIRGLTEDYATSAVVKVRNLDQKPRTYDLRTEFNTPTEAGRGVRYEVEPQQFELQPGASAEVTVRAFVTAAQLAPFAAYGGAQVFQSELVSDAEIDGFVVINSQAEGGQPEVSHLPIYFLPRQAARMIAAPDPLRISPASGRGTIEWDNEGPADSVAELFAHLGTDEAGDAPSRVDIDHLGARLGVDAQGRRIISIAMHTSAGRRVPIDSDGYALIDTNLDGSYDYAAHVGLVNGVLVTAVHQVTRQAPIAFSRQYTADFEAGVNIDSRIIVLNVLANRIGVDESGPVRIDLGFLHIANFADVAGGLDVTPYDAAPNDAFEFGAQGTISAGRGRFPFRSDELGYSLDRWTMELAGGAQATSAIERVAGVPLAGQRIMALYPRNVAGEPDMQLLAIVEAEAPTPTAIPFPTDVPPSRDHDIFLPAALADAVLERSGP